MAANIRIRNSSPADHEKVLTIMPAWWGGRDLTASLPKVFFIHFTDTSFIAETDRQFVGFLIGFMSQTEEEVGYIHFAGVHPDFRKQGIGKMLYESFFRSCSLHNRRIIKSCTSPVNEQSIGFHQSMGFSVEGGDGVINGVPVTMNYLGANKPKVLFVKNI